jgi:hypothetical protein
VPAALSSVFYWALGKEDFAESRTLQRPALGKGLIYRVRDTWHSQALGKETVADVQFAERSLPSVTLGKAFAECKLTFAECLRHSAKELCPVVSTGGTEKRQ